jgi:hypothetical protein
VVGSRSESEAGSREVESDQDEGRSELLPPRKKGRGGTRTGSVDESLPSSTWSGVCAGSDMVGGAEWEVGGVSYASLFQASIGPIWTTPILLFLFSIFSAKGKLSTFYGSVHAPNERPRSPSIAVPARPPPSLSLPPSCSLLFSGPLLSPAAVDMMQR